MDDASRRALRDLARRAEWRGRAGAAGAAQDAGTLRELGGELRAALVREPDQDSTAWPYRAIERLAAYCVKARPDWTPEQVAELARLREDAVIALAPGPGESDAVPPRPGRGRPALPNLTSLASRQSRLIALATVGCVILIAGVLALPHFVGGNGSAAPAADSSTTVPPLTSTTPASPLTSPPPSVSASASTGASASAATGSSGVTGSGAPTSAAGASPSLTAGPSNSRVTAIQISTDPLSGNPPEVILSGTATASGTGDVLITIAVNGSIPAQLTGSDPIDDSGQTSYDLTQRIDLSPWCGQGSVRLTVSSGSVSQSATVPVSGC